MLYRHHLVQRIHPSTCAPPPIVIPQLSKSLISNHKPKNLFCTRFLLLNLDDNEDLQRMVATIDIQIIVEHYVEASLIDDVFSPDSIITQYREIRGLSISARRAFE
ncbi:hypothetical protein ACH5RR_039521 [Cinchona calisaya]|uniref:Uncharacterized protein n=1 Tax=Cinchona calisaya TaxID=153742 RepID=A0ABD2XYY7_9GENT